MSFAIRSVRLYPYTIPLKMPFRISAGEIREKDGLLVEIISSDGITGWGEASVDKVPFYAHETVGSAMDLLTHSLVPILQDKVFEHPDEATEILDHYRGNHFAKAALDAALWDIYGKQMNKPVWQLLGGKDAPVEVGPSLGIKKEPSMLTDAVAAKLQEGFRRIKIKVSPGSDTDFIAAVRERFPDISLMVDANNAYSMADLDKIAEWDPYHLLMIEQPLDERDIYFHSILKKRIKTPVCLDESIHTMHDAKCSADLNSADIINIKVCRVGGLTNARRIHDFCQQQGIVNWIGSRVGSGVAEAARLAAATLPNCTLPSDCVITRMYMTDDVLTEPFKIDTCFVPPPRDPGLGFDIDRDKLKFYAKEPLTIL